MGGGEEVEEDADRAREYKVHGGRALQHTHRVLQRDGSLNHAWHPRKRHVDLQGSTPEDRINRKAQEEPPQVRHVLGHLAKALVAPRATKIRGEVALALAFARRAVPRAAKTHQSAEAEASVSNVAHDV